MSSTLPNLAFPHFIVCNAYGFYCVPDAYKDREVPTVLAGGGVYEPATLRLMRRLMRDGDVVTGGAFIGDFLPALEDGLTEDAQLITFEPNPVSRAACEMTLGLNGLSRVCLYPVAIGAASSVLSLQVSKPDGAAMAARARITDRQAEGDTLDVDVEPLDALLAPERKVTVIQLDIEGHEWPALQGARNTITRWRPTVILEAPKAWQQRDYATKLAALAPEAGYRFCGALERNAVYRAFDM